MSYRLVIVICVFALGVGAAGCSAEPEEKKKPKSAEAEYRDEQRGFELSLHFDKLAADDPTNGDYRVRTVKVDSGNVTVNTGLLPESEARPFFLGACGQLILAFDSWVEHIEIKGSDGEVHASWGDGDGACSVTGL